MPRQTKAQLEIHLNMIKTEAQQNRIIYAARDQENRALKDEIEKLKKDLEWTRRLVQNLTGIMQQSTIRER